MPFSRAILALSLVISTNACMGRAPGSDGGAAGCMPACDAEEVCRDGHCWLQSEGLEARFAWLAPDAPSGWLLEVVVEGAPGTFLHRAAPVVAYVGELPVELLMVHADGRGFSGRLAMEPPDGARLKVGYLDAGTSDTGIAYRRQTRDRDSSF
jgi:hypothetical protein